MARDRTRPVIVLGSNAALRVRGGALDIVHGAVAERASLRIDIDEPPPRAILFDGRGEFLSGEALRWCSQRGVVIIIPDGPGRMMTLLHSAGEASESASLRDVGPAIIRAQCAANPVPIAREIVRTKIRPEVVVLGPRVTPAMPRTIARCEAALESARSVAEIVMIEAKAAGSTGVRGATLGLSSARTAIAFDMETVCAAEQGGGVSWKQKRGPPNFGFGQLCRRGRGRAFGAGSRRRRHGPANRFSS
jgi:hypothetical protein